MTTTLTESSTGTNHTATTDEYRGFNGLMEWLAYGMRRKRHIMGGEA